MEETSLGDFLEDDGATVAEDRPDADESATVTASWSPTAQPCEGCGEAVTWRWRDGDALVCRECKDW